MTDESHVSPDVLEQGLKIFDEPRIKFVLEKIQEPEIPDYIRPLSPQLIPIFIKSFTKFINSQPDYLKICLPWIELLISLHQSSISASPECQKRLSELQLTLKQRTQQLGLFIEAAAATDFIKNEKDGKGVGFPINDEMALELTED